MMIVQPALSVRNRLRALHVATALSGTLACALFAGCASTPNAQTQAQPAAPVPAQTPLTTQTQSDAAVRQALQAAQNPAQATVPKGQTFEEEIEPQRYAHSATVDSFIDEMVARNHFDARTLHGIFAQANYSATAVRLVTPSKSGPSVKNWRRYRANFLDDVRINAGVRFWRANRATLQRASQTYGVPPEAIVGILGVETIYGRFMGNFRVLDALTTLAFDYPDTPNRAERMQTFRTNLADYLVWTRDSQIDPTSVLGSYTGAIGIPQFLPSSITDYAVDFDGDGRIDLRTSAADAIGSVANYLHQHGWEPGRPVVWNIGTDANSINVASGQADGKPEPHFALGPMLQAGLVIDQPGFNGAAETDTSVLVIDLPTPGQPTQYKIGLKNFYVLTRYNRSFFYALSVYELGERIKRQVAAVDAVNAAKAYDATHGGTDAGGNSSTIPATISNPDPQ